MFRTLFTGTDQLLQINMDSLKKLSESGNLAATINLVEQLQEVKLTPQELEEVRTKAKSLGYNFL
jgi:hypothetical protein